jgi:hypothetical protein
MLLSDFDNIFFMISDGNYSATVAISLKSEKSRFKVGLYSGWDSDVTDCDIAIAETMHIIADHR